MAVNRDLTLKWLFLAGIFTDKPSFVGGWK
jgi:hypothetical protein